MKIKRYWVAITILGCFVLSLCLRTILPHDYIFTGEWVKFSSFDAYWQMANVDIYAADFPAYAGQVLQLPFFQWLLSAITWCIGWGSPTQQTIDTVGVYFPAVLAALTVIPVYFIGRLMFSRMAGIVAALLVAILPGEWLGRSILGFTDHHVMETLLTACIILFIVLAVQRRNVLWGLSAGIFLGIYLLTWIGGFLFVFLIITFFILLITINHCKRLDTYYFAAVNMIIISIAFLFFFQKAANYYLAAMGIMAILPMLLVIISKYTKQIKLYYFPISVVAICLAIVIPAFLFIPGLSERIITFIPGGAGSATTLEFQPLFFPSGAFTASIAWANYGPLLFTVPIALAVLIRKAVKEGDGNIILLLIWSLVTLAMATQYRRFGYYFAINAALLTGWFIWYIKDSFGLKNKLLSAFITTLLVLLVLVPNARTSYIMANGAPYTPPDAWMKALEWVKTNTAEDSKILAWWDYGYWIEREADRFAYATPTQEKVSLNKTANIFLSKNADGIEADYIIIDYSTIMEKLWAIATWADINPDALGNTFYIIKDGNANPVELYHVDYYRSLVVRLYNFNGAMIEPNQSIVIKTDAQQLISLNAFANYEEAMAFAQVGDYVIVGSHPFKSPIPLNAIDNFSLVFASDEKVNGIPQVKIFKGVKQ